MLLVVGFLLLTFVGSGVSGHRPRRYSEPPCRKNEHYTRNNPECIRTCANKWVPHSDDCKPFTGCVCNKGLVRLNDDASGKCVPESKCPNKCKDRNAVYKDTLSPCPLTCAYPKPRPCPLAAIKKGGCECAPDFILDEANEKCVRPKDCPGNKCKDPHAVYVDCPNPCPLSCDRPFPGVCAKACIKNGCQCASGYILDNKNKKHGKCVRPKDCPAPISCPKHSQYVLEDNQCQKTCGNRLLPYSDVAGACVPFTGCSCKSGYVRLYDNATGPCIPEQKCPPIPTQCGENEVATSCRITCPPQTCDTDRVYDCPEPICKPGCDCKNDYLRNEDGICILSKDCPKPEQCGENEVASDCAIQCPPQSCESLFTTYLCSKPTCTPGCNCIDGYLRNSLEKCVPSEECFNDPAGCGGDVNATHTQGCNSPTQPSCNNPDPKIRSDICQLNGCECKTGYIRSEGGNCIESKDCPGGSPNCGTNQTYVGCKFGCPTNYCPVDDSRAIVACSPPFICQAGCACMGGYLIVSYDNPQCVLASDCPEFKCTRPNEVFDRNPTKCFSERCEDRGSECSPYPLGPRCVCEDDFYRNENDTCVHVSECPPLACKDDLNATYTDCPSYCPMSCDDIAQEPKGCIAACAPAGCACNPGYVLNKDGKCINPEDCPVTNAGCRGDPNAVYKGCPSACEPTCAKPDRNQPCTKQCLPPGCVCKPDYVLNEETGKCVKPKTCPAVGCNGDPNATYFNCTSSCPPSCDDIGQEPTICIALCGPPGCQCNSGYVLNKDGKCVKPEDCPVIGCGGDPNGVYKECISACEPTCTNPDPQICTLQCLTSGCACKEGYVKNEETGKCVKRETCPVVGCNGDRNATYTDCTSSCAPSCADIGQEPRGCAAVCGPGGCQCKSGYVLNKDGKCIKPEDCPVVDEGCGGDLNATPADCPSSCPPTCADRNSKVKTICPAVCDPSGCVCKKGYILIKKGGKCVKPEDCPAPGCKGDPNAVFSDCPSACEPSCSNPKPSRCTRQCKSPGCICKPDFVLNEKTGKCVRLKSCPVVGCKGDRNATYTKCTSYCPPTCADIDEAPRACIALCGPGGCACNPGYLLNQEGKCVDPKDCPVTGCGGDPNAKYKDCPSACEPSCLDPKPQVCTEQCLPPSCVCKPDFVLNNETGKCVRVENCPVIGCGGDPNGVFKDCISACEPTCSNPDPQICTLQCLPSGCACKEGYVKNEETGKCVERETCPEKGCKGDPNAMYSDCPSACEPTCLKPDPNQPCTYQCLSPGCVCMPGFVRNEKTGKCINPETCPAEPQCKGDRNATYTKSPEYCQPTCKDPEPEGCMDMRTPPACICKPGYIFNKKGGRCIRPTDCPGGLPKCRTNETYVYCNAGCPTDYCPVDDSRDIIACDPPYPCLGGCACQAGYLIASENDDRCIWRSECPQLECTRPNEIWDPNALGCLRERCDDRGIPCDYQYPGPPRCVCHPGYYRNDNDICVPECQCPKPGCNGDLNATFSNCPSRCPATCGDSPDQICTADCAEPGCVCNDGYVRSEPGGICIRREDCGPTTPVCGKNEIAKDCRRICPPQTCLSKYALFRCVANIPCKPGCDCIPNYLRNDQGICIPSEKCPPLEPEPICGYNEVSVPCRQICPPQNCEIAYTDYACTDETKICEPGCDCLPDHLRNGSGICIPNEKCPYPSTPVCGINEIARDCKQICPPQSCRSKYIEYSCLQYIACKPGCDCVSGYLRNDEGICMPSDTCPPLEPICGYNEVSVPCRQICPPQNCDIAYTDYACTKESEICEPGCDCLPDHLRNGSRICIPNDQCPGLCQVTDECKRTCASPNPPNCGYNPPEENINGCDCKEGYILSELGGDCIPIENCPPETACNGDPNALPKRCPKPCPSTCDSPNQTPCKRACDPLACECKPGYLLSNATGLCILPDKCSCGNPCGKNGQFVDCKTDCPYDYCPVDDSRALIFCDPPAGYCLSGCICGLNSKRKSREHPKCITSSDCPPVNCTRPNEVWDSCPSACLAENCEDIPYQPTTCNTLVLNCQPRCVCKKNHFRNSDGICIPARKCPVPQCEDVNAVFKSCVSACEPTCASPTYEVCTEECRPGRCVCKDGFVLNENDGKCVTLEQCPVPVCDDVNAVYKSCVSACEPTCASPTYQICTDECRPGRCVCKDGYVLNQNNGKCVKPRHCPAC